MLLAFEARPKDQNTLTFDNLTPFSEMTQQSFRHLLLIRAFLDFANVQCSVLTVERSDATHVISVVGVLLPSKTVSRVVR